MNDAVPTAGKGWFDMQKPVMTKELAVDLKILQVRVHALVCAGARRTLTNVRRRIAPL